MRIFNTLKNIIYGIGACIVLGVLTIYIRKLFVEFLPIELLGYESLFGNLFALFALADLGLETIIAYRLYPAFAKKDERAIKNIMGVYSYLYRRVGLLILFIGLAIVPIVPHIAKGNNLPWSYVYVIYFMQLCMVLFSYFYAYKRIVLVVDQKSYICSKIETICSFIFSVVKITVIVIFRSYLLYLLLSCLNNLVVNYLISKKVDKDYSFIAEVSNTSYNDINRLGLWKDIKNNLAQKIGGTIYGGTDNIVVGTFLGVTQVGILGNYMMLLGMVQKLLDKLLDPFQAAIGNMVHSNTENKDYSMFYMLDLFSFFIASVVCSCFFVLLNPFINIWLGAQFTFDIMFVAFFSLNQYINWNHHFLCFFRNTFGKYEIDKPFIMAGAIINLVISVTLWRWIGISGIVLGTVMGHMAFWIGRTKVVYSEYVTDSIFIYIKNQFIRGCLCFCECILIYKLSEGLPVTLYGLFIRLLLCVLLTCGINFLVFRKSKEFNYMNSYFEKVRQIAIIKVKQL